jgi:hypothetical protein
MLASILVIHIGTRHGLERKNAKDSCIITDPSQDISTGRIGNPLPCPFSALRVIFPN